MPLQTEAVMVPPPRAGVHAWLDRLFGIPHCDARAAALFRIGLGTCVALLVLMHVQLSDPGGAPVVRDAGTGYGAGAWPVAHWLRAHPPAHVAIHLAAVASA